MRKRILFIMFALVGVMMLTFARSAPLQAATIPIDSFTDTTIALADEPSDTAGIYTCVTDSVVTSANGGIRKFGVRQTSGTGTVHARVNTVAEYFVFDSPTETSGNVRITWDNDPAVTPACNSRAYNLNTDLTDGGSNNHLMLEIIADHPGWGMQVDLYTTNGTNVSTYNYTEGQSINSIGRVYLIPFSAFSAGATLTDIDAIEINVTGVDDLDWGLNFFESVDIDESLFDFGDLPQLGPIPSTSNYNITTLSANGAGHLNPGTTIELRRNTEPPVDTEVDGQPSASAGSLSGGDNNNGPAPDDEQGVRPIGNWVGFGQKQVEVYVTGPVDGCLSGWIDWRAEFSLGSDGIFNPGYGEYFIINQPVSEAGNPNIFNFNQLSPDFSNTTLYARFRVVPDVGEPGCADQAEVQLTGLVDDGEVEDYRWVFSPTAVDLQSFSADSSNNLPVYGLIVLAALVMVGFVALVLRRERTKA